jgi:predicted secreted protein
MTGKDITVILSRNNTALANTRIRSNEIQTSCDMIEKASASQQDWKEYVAGRNSWTLTVNYLVLASAQVADLLYVGQTFDITMKSGNSELLTGSAIITGVKNTATVGNLAQGGFTLQGSGALSIPQ